MYYIYGTPTCSYCKEAKKLLDYNFIEYTYFDLTDGDNIVAAFKSLFPGKTSVPQIMHNGHYVGGYNELKDYINGK